MNFFFSSVVSILDFNVEIPDSNPTAGPLIFLFLETAYSSVR